MSELETEVEMSEAEVPSEAPEAPEMSETDIMEALKAQMESVQDHIDVTDVRPLMGAHSDESGESQLAVYLKLVGADKDGPVEHTYAFDPAALLRTSIMLSQVAVEVLDASASVMMYQAQQATAGATPPKAPTPYL